MIVAFANNQVIVGEAGTISSITTDPVPMNGNDRGSAILNVHYILGGTTQAVRYFTETSNDGATWVDGGPTGSRTSAGVSGILAGPINGAFVRLRFEFEITSGTGQGAVCFDLHMNLDHA